MNLRFPKSFKAFSFKNCLHLICILIISKIKKTYTHSLLIEKRVVDKLIREGYSVIFYNNRSYVVFSDKMTLNKKFIIRLYSSDIKVFYQVIQNQEYFPLIELIEKKSSSQSIRHIVDAGSNIGLSMIYFKHFFNDSHVIAIEPDLDNRNILIQNSQINNFKDVVIENKGLWKNNSPLYLTHSNRDGKEWSISLSEVKIDVNTKIETMTMQDIFTNYNISVIDLLKIDIEGAERELFSDTETCKLFQKVKFLAIEIHDEFDCRNLIYDKLSSLNFDFFDVGETTYAFNKSLIGHV